MDSIISTMDKSLGKELMRALKKEGFKFHMEHRVVKVENKGKKVVLTAENKKTNWLNIK